MRPIFLIFCCLFSVAFAEQGEVSLEEVTAECQRIGSDPYFKVMHNVLKDHSVGAICRDHGQLAPWKHSFSDEIATAYGVTDQQHAGLCWLYAGFNLLRRHMEKSIQPDAFEFSSAYLFFFDRVERANYYFENIIALASEPLDGLKMREMLGLYVDDGSNWNNFTFLVKKYGLVPKSVFTDSFSNVNTSTVNRVLGMYMLKCAHVLRKMHKNGASESALRARKAQCMQGVYKILVAHFGVPPTQFDWNYTKGKKVEVKGGITPHAFRDEIVDFPFDDYVMLLHAPQEEAPLYRTYSIDRSERMQGGIREFYLNLPIEEIKEIVLSMVKEGEPVYFSADVESHADFIEGVFEENLYLLNDLYQIDFEMDKGARLSYGASIASHVMLITGVHLEDERPVRWKVENSWGGSVGKQGYYTMSDAWFDQYVIHAVVPKHRLTKKQRKLFRQKPILWPSWHIMYHPKPR